MAETIAHKLMKGVDAHALTRWEVADLAARDALVVATADLHKLCFIESEGAYHVLSAVDPDVAWTDLSDTGSEAVVNAALVGEQIVLTQKNGTEITIALPNSVVDVSYNAGAHALVFTYFDGSTASMPLTEEYDGNAIEDVSQDAETGDLTFTYRDTSTKVVEAGGGGGGSAAAVGDVALMPSRSTAADWLPLKGGTVDRADSEELYELYGGAIPGDAFVEEWGDGEAGAVSPLFDHRECAYARTYSGFVGSYLLFPHNNTAYKPGIVYDTQMGEVTGADFDTQTPYIAIASAVTTPVIDNIVFVTKEDGGDYKELLGLAVESTTTSTYVSDIMTDWGSDIEYVNLLEALDPGSFAAHIIALVKRTGDSAYHLASIEGSESSTPFTLTVHTSLGDIFSRDDIWTQVHDNKFYYRARETSGGAISAIYEVDFTAVSKTTVPMEAFSGDREHFALNDDYIIQFVGNSLPTESYLEIYDRATGDFLRNSDTFVIQSLAPEDVFELINGIMFVGSTQDVVTELPFYVFQPATGSRMVNPWTFGEEVESIRSIIFDDAAGDLYAMVELVDTTTDCQRLYSIPFDLYDTNYPLPNLASPDFRLEYRVYAPGVSL